ncbi:CoA protein activase [Thermincola ferriacetica]
MKITYPNMGNLGIAVKCALAGLRFEVVPPPPVTKATASIGARFAPEGACYPFKLVLGNVIEGLEQGADTVIMLGGEGPCRFGYFGHLMGEILRDAGYRCHIIVLEGEETVQQLDALRVAANATWAEVYKAVKLGWAKICAADRIESVVHRCRPLERKTGQVTKIFGSGLIAIDKAMDRESLVREEEKTLQAIRQAVESKRKPVLKIGLVGDIYMLIESYANYRVEEFLNGMGIEVCRSIFISGWIKNHLGKIKAYLHKQGLLKDAFPYLTDFVGGHGVDTVANTIRYYRQGIDGIIHILPMTCMPEIVAQSVIPKLRQETGIPVLTLVLDEHSASAGLYSRLEAFADMLLRRKVMYI